MLRIHTLKVDKRVVTKWQKECSATSFSTTTLIDGKSAAAIIGSDFAGTIIETGSGLSQLARLLAVGDRVYGAVHGCNPADPRSGAFSQYVKADASLVMKVPASMAWEDAATLGVALGTSCISFWKALGLTATPNEPAATPFPILVYGGSTAMGTMAVQILKL